jgi:hypothetical protein
MGQRLRRGERLHQKTFSPAATQAAISLRSSASALDQKSGEDTSRRAHGHNRPEQLKVFPQAESGQVRGHELHRLSAGHEAREE